MMTVRFCIHGLDVSGINYLKSGPLYRRIGIESHEESIGGGENWLGNFRAAKTTQNAGIRRVAVVQLDVVVRTLLIVLHLEMGEFQLNPDRVCK